MIATVGLGVVGVLLFVLFLIAFIKSDNFIHVLALFTSSFVVLVCFLASMAGGELDSRIKNCSGFVNVRGYDIDTATSSCFFSGHALDCARITKILPAEIKRCIELNEQ